MKKRITLAMVIFIGFVLCSAVAAYMPMLIIRECPHCKAHVVQEETVSGNTIGATYWTDGKREAKMLPDHSWLAKCPACFGLFWVDESVEVDIGFDAAKGKQQVLSSQKKSCCDFWPVRPCPGIRNSTCGYRHGEARTMSGAGTRMPLRSSPRLRCKTFTPCQRCWMNRHRISES
jgi:hypothetical protein